jgi:hypothetical protein
MATTITSQQLLEAARDLNKPEFTRADLAKKLGTGRGELRDAFKGARREGAIEKTGEDANGKGLFRVAAG